MHFKTHPYNFGSRSKVMQDCLTCCLSLVTVSFTQFLGKVMCWYLVIPGGGLSGAWSWVLQQAAVSRVESVGSGPFKSGEEKVD